MIPRRQPMMIGPDVNAAPPPAPMQFAPVEQTQGGQPDLSPLMMALQQRLAQNANTAVGSSKVADSPMRKKPAFGAIMDHAQGGGYGNA